MRSIIRSMGMLLLAGSVAGCLKSPLGPSPIIVPAAPVAAAPTPTMVATAVPGQYPAVTMRVLGTVPCTGSAPGATAHVLRSASDWAAWIGNPSCAAPGGLDLSSFDFSAETVLILQDLHCGITRSELIRIWDVTDRGGFLSPRSDIDDVTYGYLPAESDCHSYAVAIPATTSSLSWTICLQTPGYHCLGPVTP